ncbi:MAG TPA: phosphate signaling complex protein PhoU [Methanotrichaceae archaeon]|nr:phosphate signaling complex protein PhoU [Methanotrichaceae archaeon]
MNPYRERYFKELDALKTDTDELIRQVNYAVVRSVEALIGYDVEKAKEILQMDQVVDDLNQKIENRCMELLALQQPMAKDLRMIVGILKIGIDLERIGDLAVDIARVTIQSRNTIHITRLEFIPRMAEVASRMLLQTAEALKNDDSAMARQITKWDYEIDGLYGRVRDKIFKIVVNNPELVDDATPLLLVNRHLERIGDHVCNICESIVYMVEAKREHLN